MDARMVDLLTKLFHTMPVAIISGGAWSQFDKQMFSQFPPGADFAQLYIFPTSASVCFSFAGSWVQRYEHALSAEDRVTILAAIAEGLKVTGLEKPDHQIWGERIDDRGSQITFSLLGQLAPPELKKTWDPERKIRGPLRDFLAERLPGFSVRTNASSSIDITHAHITKAYGVQKYAELTGIPVSEMVYIGDGLFEGGNDAVVKETGIPTIPVTGPDETALLISQILS
jgi:hypothetical protein